MAHSNATKIVPFGKYRNKPVQIMLQDQEYCNWLTAQNWFQDRFRDLHLTIISTNEEPEDTPEHNLMQARLSDQNYVNEIIIQPFWKDYRRKFEECGITSFGPVVYTDFEVGGWDNVTQFCVNKNESSNFKFDSIALLIEAKPTLGDDYPTVVREVNSRFDKTVSAHHPSPYSRFMSDGRAYPKPVIWFDDYHGSVPMDTLRLMFKRILFIKTKP